MQRILAELPRPVDLAWALTLAAGVLGATVTGAGSGAGPAEKAEALYLGLLAAAVCGLAALCRPMRSGSTAASLAALAVVLLAWAAPSPPARAAAVLAVLVVLFLHTAIAAVGDLGARDLPAGTAELRSAATAREGSSDVTVIEPNNGYGFAETGWIHGGSLAFLLLLAAQILLRSGRWIDRPFDFTWWVTLLGLPAAAAVGAALLARRHGALASAVVAGVVLLAVPGLTVASTLALLLAAGGLSLLPRRSLAGLGGRLAGALVALLLAIALLFAAYPWLRRSPFAALAAGLPALGRPGRVLVEGEPVVVAAAQPLRALDLDGAPVEEIVLDTQLAHAAALPTGTTIATLRLVAADGAVHPFALRTGRETGEWAARRPDVAGIPGFVAPPAFRSELALRGDRAAEGIFFAQRYRASFRLGAAVRAARIEVERAPDLPAETMLLIFRAELVP